MIECPQCTVQQQYVLEQLQTSAGVTDRTALAVILGNIHQESTFKPNVCEGGAIVPYDRCLDGGYGLIQWTSKHRYLGLGTFCAKRNADPSGLKCQTDYMIHEMRFRKDLYAFQTNQMARLLLLIREPLPNQQDLLQPGSTSLCMSLADDLLR